MAHVTITLALLAGIYCMPSVAQGYLYLYGSPTFNTPSTVEQGFVNLANGNLHIEIPLASFPQRGRIGFSAKLVYDSRIWTQVFNGTSIVWSPTNVANSQGGWRFVTTADKGTVSYASSQDIACDDGIHTYYTNTYGPFFWTDPSGTQHTFPITTWTWPPGNLCPGGGPGQSTGDAFASDSSGLHMYVTGYFRANVFAKDGTQVYNSNTSFQVKDANGNYTTASNGNVVDTLNRTPVTSAVNGNTTTYSVLNSQGSTSTFTVTTTTVNYHTNFGQSGVTDVSGSFSAIQSIGLPDGTSYNFTYDSGTQAGNYGLLQTMQLPTLGGVFYGFTTFADSYGYRNRWLNTRISDGIWTYDPAVITTCPTGGTGCKEKVTVSQPSGDQEVYTFTLNNGSWNTETDYYTGSVDPANLTQTVVTDYDMSLNAYIRPIRVTTTVPVPGGNLSKKTEYSYDSTTVANVTAIKEWNLYSGTPPSSPDRETDKTYIADSNHTDKDIRDRPLTVTVNVAGSPVAKTLYTYDSTALSSVAGITHHDDTGYGTGNTYRGNPTVMQKWVGGTTYITETKYYDTTGQLVQWTDSNGNNTYYSYTDSFYNDNGANPPSTFTPSAPTNAYLTQKTLLLIGAETYGYYFGTGKQARSLDQNGADTYSHYMDSLDRITTAYTAPINGANRGWTLTQYTSATQQDIYSAINDAAPSVSCVSCIHQEVTLDAMGRVIETMVVSNPMGPVKSDTVYDSSARVQQKSNPYVSQQDPTYGINTYALDGLNRVTSVTRPDGNIAHAYYGASVSSGGGASSQLCSSTTYGFGIPALIVDEAGKKKQTWRDGFDRTIEVDEPDSSNNLTVATCYKYDALNDLVSVVQGSQTRTYSYDALSRKTQEILPESGTTTYYYTNSSAGLCSGDPQLVCRRTDARNITTTYSYDALNRLTGKTYTDTTPSASYSYDQTNYNGLSITNGKGRRTGMSDGSGQTAWSYDPGGRVLTEKRTIAGITKSTSYTYNLAGQVATLTYPSGHTLTYAYDNAGHQSSVIDSASGINYAQNATYSTDGALTSAVHGKVDGGFAGITRTYTYNDRMQLSTMQVSSSNGTVQDVTYSYDLGSGANNGNVASITNNLANNRTQTFTYDNLNRVLTAQTQGSSGPYCWGQSFANGYDRYGNLTTISVTKCSAPSLSLSVNNSNQITNTNFTYDAAGNMTHDGSQAYTWDAENRLRTAAGVTYTYDGDGWRRKSSNGTLFWDDAGRDHSVLVETDLSGNVPKEYIYLAGRRIARRASAGTFYFFDDHLGSARVLTNPTGVVQRESDYYPFGGEIVITNNALSVYAFTGKRRDTETGFDYSLYRMYYPNLGRWMTTDPVRGTPGDPQAENLYSYVRNRPTKLGDPLGNRPPCQEPGGYGWIPWLDPVVLLGGYEFTSGGDYRLPEPMCVDGAWDFDFSDVTLPRWEIAHTCVVWQLAVQGPPECFGFFGGRCQYKVVDNCTPETTPPDNSLNGELVGWGRPDGDYYISWIVSAFCTRGPNGGWACLYGYASLLSVNVPVQPYACTHNP